MAAKLAVENDVDDRPASSRNDQIEGSREILTVTGDTDDDDRYRPDGVEGSNRAWLAIGN